MIDDYEGCGCATTKLKRNWGRIKRKTSGFDKKKKGVDLERKKAEMFKFWSEMKNKACDISIYCTVTIF